MTVAHAHHSALSGKRMPTENHARKLSTPSQNYSCTRGSTQGSGPQRGHQARPQTRNASAATPIRQLHCKIMSMRIVPWFRRWSNPSAGALSQNGRTRLTLFILCLATPASTRCSKKKLQVCFCFRLVCSHRNCSEDAGILKKEASQ